MRHRTLVLSRADVARLLPMPELIEAIRAAYVSHAAAPAATPQKSVARDGGGSTTIVFPGALTGADAYTVKVNAKVPDNVARGLPFLVGTILLLDRATGVPLAILESGLITAMRTAAAGTVGVATLARPDAGRVALLGAGVQGEWQLRALHALGRLESAAIADVVPERAEARASRLARELGRPIAAVDSAGAAAAGADVLITVTPSRVPILGPALLRPGLHINAFGADEPGKVELSADLIREALVVVDDRSLALTAGALNVAWAAGDLDETAIDAEIGEVLIGRHPGRTTADQVTVFGNVGLAFQDLVAARIVFDRARADGAGAWVELW